MGAGCSGLLSFLGRHYASAIEYHFGGLNAAPKVVSEIMRESSICNIRYLRYPVGIL